MGHGCCGPSKKKNEQPPGKFEIFLLLFVGIAVVGAYVWAAFAGRLG